MIGSQQKGKKKRGTVKSTGGSENFAVKKNILIDGINITYSSELDKFTGDEFIPEKYKEDEIRLANSILPDSSSSFK
jgi:hypothetical protein